MPLFDLWALLADGFHDILHPDVESLDDSWHAHGNGHNHWHRLASTPADAPIPLAVLPVAHLKRHFTVFQSPGMQNFCFCPLRGHCVQGGTCPTGEHVQVDGCKERGAAVTYPEDTSRIECVKARRKCTKVDVVGQQGQLDCCADDLPKKCKDPVDCRNLAWDKDQKEHPSPHDDEDRETQEELREREKRVEKIFEECRVKEAKCEACRMEYCTTKEGWCENKCLSRIEHDAEFKLDRHHIYVKKLHGDHSMLHDAGVGRWNEIESIDGKPTVNEMRTKGVDLSKALHDLDPNKEHKFVFHDQSAWNTCTHEETCCMKGLSRSAPDKNQFVECPAKDMCKDNAVCDEALDENGNQTPEQEGVCKYQIWQLKKDPDPPEED